jgi:hypothetical protein
VGLESLIFARGMFESGGYARFLVPISGPVAVLAAAGARSLATTSSRWVVLLAGAVAAGWLAAEGVYVGSWVEPYMPLKLLWGLSGLCGAVGVLGLVERRAVRAGLAKFAVCGLAVMALVQAGASLRPLRLSDSPLLEALAHAVEFIEARYPNRPGMSQHVVVQYLLPDSITLYSNADALAKWRQAPPGSLFVWESKYCVKPHEPKSTADLREALDRLGREVWTLDVPANRVEQKARVRVFLRTDAPYGGADVTTSAATDTTGEPVTSAE